MDDMPSRVDAQRAERYFQARQLGHDRTAACRIAHVSRGWAVTTEQRIRDNRSATTPCPVCGCGCEGTGHELDDLRA